MIRYRRAVNQYGQRVTTVVWLDKWFQPVCESAVISDKG